MRQWAYIKKAPRPRHEEGSCDESTYHYLSGQFLTSTTSCFAIASRQSTEFPKEASTKEILRKHCHLRPS